jgi:hypothetical protein
MKKKNQPANTPGKQKPNRDNAKSNQHPGKQTKNGDQYIDDPEKTVKITDDPEGTKQKIPNMES